jgi:hypothetical protein
MKGAEDSDGIALLESDNALLLYPNASRRIFTAVLFIALKEVTEFQRLRFIS